MEKIGEKVKRLIETKQRYLKLIKSEDPREASVIIQLIIEAVSLINEIKLAITEHDPESLEIEDNEIRNTLKLIREDKPLIIAEAYKTLREHLQPSSTGAHDEDLSDFVGNYSDRLFELFHSKFDVYSYFYDKLQIGPLITSSSLPLALKNYFYELKEAYAYGLHKACVALCRMLLEIGFADCLSRIETYKDATHLNRIAKSKKNFDFSLFENINIAVSLNLISKDLADKANNVRRMGNKTVHFNEAHSKNVTINTFNTFEIIKDTVAIIESIYV